MRCRRDQSPRSLGALAGAWAICKEGGVNRPLLFFRASRWLGLALGLGLTLCFALLGIVLTPWLGEGYASLVFVVGIAAVGALYGLLPALISAAIGALLFDFFISEPVFEFTLTRTTDLAPPLVFTACALISGWLSGRLRDEATRANSYNLQLESLLDVSRQLQRAASDEEVWRVVLASAQGAGLGLYRAVEGRMVPVSGSPGDAAWCEIAQAACRGTQEWLARDGLIGLRLLAGAHVVGAMVVAQGRADIGFLLACGRMAALALERINLTMQLSEVHAVARTEELKTALLASVSHDLRTPLTTISTSAASLLAFGEHFDGETSRELLKGIVDESSRLNHLTTNLLQMTRLQAGDQGLCGAILPVAETLQAVVGRMRQMAGARAMMLCAPPQELLVRADTALFDLALTNVLQNAVYYSPDSSTIAVDCSAQGGDCVIAITDEGVGIAPDQQQRVFERFYRVERGGRGPRGSGLGLAIARGFVQASGGTIALVSPVREARGTTVIIRLPLVEATEFPHEAMDDG